MIQIIFHENGTGNYIKQWPNWSGVVPSVGDLVVLHFGDDNEEEVTYCVRLRVIDGTQPDRINIFIEETEQSTDPHGLTGEEIENIRREMEKAYIDYNTDINNRNGNKRTESL